MHSGSGGTTEASRGGKPWPSRRTSRRRCRWRTHRQSAWPSRSRRRSAVSAASRVGGLLRDRHHRCAGRRHPSLRAAQISRNAAEAARATGTPIVAFVPPAWTRARATLTGARWRRKKPRGGGAGAIGAAPRRVLLTTGRLGLTRFAVAPQHHYVVRTIDPPRRRVLAGCPSRPALRSRSVRSRGRAGLDGARADRVVVTRIPAGAATYRRSSRRARTRPAGGDQQPPLLRTMPRVASPGCSLKMGRGVVVANVVRLQHRARSGQSP